MKIRTKLLLGLSTLPIILIILIGSGIVQIANFNKTNAITQENYDFSILAASIQRDIKDEAISIRNLLIYDSEERIQSERNNIQSIQGRISDNIAILEEAAVIEEDKNMMNELKTSNQEFNQYADQVIGFITDGNTEDALALMNGNSRSIQENIFNVISEITTAFETGMHASIESTSQSFKKDIILESIIIIVAIIFIFLLLFRNIRTLTSRLTHVSNAMNRIAMGQTNLDTEVEEDASNDEITDVVKSFNQMAVSLEEQRNKNQELIWKKTNIADITTSLSGAQTIESLSEIFLSKIVPLVEGSHAVFYIQEDHQEDKEKGFKLCASYAFKERKHITNEIQAGEGLIGQAILEKSPIILSNVPSDYITIQSGLGEAAPLNLYVLPILYEKEVIGVVEIASFHAFNESQQSFLEEIISDLGIILDNVMGRIRLAKLLEETQVLMEEIQAQSEELQTQQDELKATNEELEQQTITLQESEEKLQAQQEELEQTNVDLEEGSIRLKENNKNFAEKNKELEMAKHELEEKARQLAKSSKYKSEFLANMSHELRTPLNSMLILSKLLADNPDGILSSKQVEYAKTIHSSGKDLLVLINDILDLSKIESGKTDVNPSKVVLTDIAEFVESSFRPVANDRKLKFDIVMSKDVPENIFSDEVKIQQVLKNLLANAFKFTDKGNVSLEIKSDRQQKNPMLVFSVVDTGIGISQENQEIIFEAFQQADGTTSRKFGGTGLGLSISKEIANLLHGKLEVESEEGKGSRFSFYVGDYEEEINVLNESLYTAEIAASSETVILEDEKESEKQSALEPTAVMKSGENSHIKTLLLVEDDMKQRNSIMELIGDMDVIMKSVSTGSEAVEELKRDTFDCMILDLGLTDTSGFDLLEKIMNNASNGRLKVFIYTGRDLSLREELYLNKYANTIIIKDEHAPQRLKSELELYLEESNLAQIVDDQTSTEPNPDFAGLAGRKILLADDDVRNVYALSSVLELYGMDIIFAENGLECLELLEMNPDVDLILMDIMMPEMDGNEAIRKVREMPKFENLPIIAITAKAMKEDREKSFQAGASDYIVKPINPDQLISLIKVWLSGDEGNSINE
ncbi:response regulator [Oceanobacillus sp. CF4.6]|uniref:response regulator n=1 Tax=Oceanobacillus sp. CF4.6 TaxID=3373080 RepID=UPI003EE6164F